MPTRLEPLTPANVLAACDLSVRPDQADFVAPVPISLAEAYVHPDTAWTRLVYASEAEAPVAFVMAAFSEEGCYLWRLNVAAEQQGRGYGRVAVEGVVEEARRRGIGAVTVSWVPGEGGPEGFYRKLGFEPTGKMHDHEVEAILTLRAL